MTAWFGGHAHASDIERVYSTLACEMSHRHVRVWLGMGEGMRAYFGLKQASLWLQHMHTALGQHDFAASEAATFTAFNPTYTPRTPDEKRVCAHVYHVIS